MVVGEGGGGWRKKIVKLNRKIGAGGLMDRSISCRQSDHTVLYTGNKKCWWISLYVTDDAIAKLYVT